MNKINRKNAIYSDSRLYRQAEEGSQIILEYLNNIKNPYQQVILKLSKNKENSLFLSASQTQYYLESCKQYLREKVSIISPYLGIPILLQTIEDFYYREGVKRQKPYWLGTALKITLAHVWNNLSSKSPIESKSIKALLEVIPIASVYEQLYFANEISRLFDNIEIVLDGEGLSPYNNDTYLILNEYYSAFKDRGKSFRTLNVSLAILHKELPKSIEAIEQILDGAEPSEQKIFKGTFFYGIPKSDPIAFWAGLLSRLYMQAITENVRSEVTDNPSGISIFETVVLLRSITKNRETLYKEMTETFWKKSGTKI